MMGIWRGAGGGKNVITQGGQTVLSNQDFDIRKNTR